MIGNDVVDIAFSAEKNKWKRKGFLEKIFTSQEQEIIYNSDDSDKTVWLLWSMKESAYKAYARKYPGRFIAPRKFNCVIIKNGTGKVSFKESTIKTESIVGESFISTYAFFETDISCEKINVEKIIFSKADYKTQHKEIYSAILKKISSISNEDEKLFNIVKDKFGVPAVINSKTKSKILISLSHHGLFGAFIYLTNN